MSRLGVASERGKNKRQMIEFIHKRREKRMTEKMNDLSLYLQGWKKCFDRGVLPYFQIDLIMNFIPNESPSKTGFRCTTDPSKDENGLENSEKFQNFRHKFGHFRG